MAGVSLNNHSFIHSITVQKYILDKTNTQNNIPFSLRYKDFNRWCLFLFFLFLFNSVLQGGGMCYSVCVMVHK